MLDDRRREMFPKNKVELSNYGGLNITPAPLYYNGSSFMIKDGDDWKSESYDSVYGKNQGSYYFTYTELGSYFDSDGANFSENSGSIDNAHTLSWGGYSDWRVPTAEDWHKIFTCDTSTAFSSPRSGATVCGNANKHYAALAVDYTAHGSPGVYGLLLFPDGGNFPAGTFESFNSYDNWQGTQISQQGLADYLAAGCDFLPAIGLRNNSQWASFFTICTYWSTLENRSYDAYDIIYSPLSGYFFAANQMTEFKSYYLPVRLVRTV